MKITFGVSLVVAVAGVVLSIHGRSDLPVLVAFAAVIVAAKSGVEAYWAGVAARRRAGEA